MTTTRVVGIDAAGKHGWVAILLDDGAYAGAHLGSLRTIVDWAEPVAVVGIDIPIGHVAGGRLADRAARKFVGPKLASSVFPTPPAEALGETTYAELNAALSEQGRSMMSKQAWALVPKMSEALALATDDARVYEVHPEVSFCAMADGHLAWSKKKSWNGLHLRHRLLADHGIVVPGEIDGIDGVAADDVVDAAAVAWSAFRIARGEALTLPERPEESGGRQVAIWY